MAKQIIEMALSSARRRHPAAHPRLLLTGEVRVCHPRGEDRAGRVAHLAYFRRSGLVTSRRDGPWIHYRLATPSDPVVAAIIVAVRHGLTHMDAVRRDAERLQKNTGCCLPSPDHASGLSCCNPAEPAAMSAAR